MTTAAPPTLAPQQATALDMIAAWLKQPSDNRSGKLFNLQGYAGTGKTTIARTAAALANRRVVFLAPTGKAASVMRRKGCEGAQTIHRALYLPKIRSTKTLQELTAALADAKTEAERTRLQAALKVETIKQRGMSWDVRESSELNDADLVVVDEASMVPDHMIDDICRHANKVLCLSDPAQLPPVRGTSSLVLRAPDMLLTDVHRQALDSTILRAATAVRNERDHRKITGPGFEIVHSSATSWAEHYAVADQVLVAKNATRRNMNARFRSRLSRGGLLALEDRVVFLRNNYEEGVYNGTTGTVTGLGAFAETDGTLLVDMDTDEGARPGMSIWSGALEGKEVPRFIPDETTPIDYGYALTVHKAQGSEWDHVLIWDEYAQRDRARWLYTALTRGAKAVTIVTP